MGGQGHYCCHFTLWNEEITLELLAALWSSEFSSRVVLCTFFGGFSFCLLIWNVTTQQSSARAEEFTVMEKHAILRGMEGGCRFTAELRVQSCTARTEHVKQSENRKLEFAMRFIFLAQGYDGIRLSRSVCISSEWCALIALKSMRNTRLRAVKQQWGRAAADGCRLMDLLYIYERRMEK